MTSGLITQLLRFKCLATIQSVMEKRVFVLYPGVLLEVKRLYVFKVILCVFDSICFVSVCLSSLPGDRTALWTICQDDFHGTKWRLVGIWKPRTKTPLLNNEWKEVSKERTSLLILSFNPKTVSPPLVSILQPHPTTSAFIPMLLPMLLFSPHTHTHTHTHTQNTEHSAVLWRRQKTTELQCAD